MYELLNYTFYRFINLKALLERNTTKKKWQNLLQNILMLYYQVSLLIINLVIYSLIILFLFLGKKKSKSTTVEVTEKASTKRGQKRKATSPVAPTPAEPNSTSTTGTRSRSSYQDVKVPGTDIAVFTPEFLEYNKS